MNSLFVFLFKVPLSHPLAEACDYYAREQEMKHDEFENHVESSNYFVFGENDAVYDSSHNKEADDCAYKARVVSVPLISDLLQSLCMLV